MYRVHKFYGVQGTQILQCTSYTDSTGHTVHCTQIVLNKVYTVHRLYWGQGT